jgi:hypothetical protein
MKKTLKWKFIGRLFRGGIYTYVVWTAKAEGGKTVFQTTLGDNPPSANSGGYFELDAMLRLKGYSERNLVRL